jgi:hypothetical protein
MARRWRASARTGPLSRAVHRGVQGPSPRSRFETRQQRSPCVHHACEPFSTGHQPADRPTRVGRFDLRKHHQPSSDNTGHDGPGLSLNLRVRGSSPWRRTMSDLGFCSSLATGRRHVVGPNQANECKKRAALARIAAAIRNLRVRNPGAGSATWRCFMGRPTAPRNG